MNSKSTAIIVLLSSSYFLVHHLEVLYFITLLISIFFFLSIILQTFSVPYFLGHHDCLKLFCYSKQFLGRVPINYPMIVNETFSLHQITFIGFKKLLHMTLLQRKTKLSWQEIVPHKCHQKNKIINDRLYILHFQLGHALWKFSCKVLFKHINDHILKLRIPIFSRIGCCILNNYLSTNPKECFMESYRIRQTLEISKERDNKMTSASAE